MYIDDYTLRRLLTELLRRKTRNQIVQEIKLKGDKFHQYNLDKFLEGKDVSLTTLQKIDKYVCKQYYLDGRSPLL
jgi:hypothetical protein